MYWTAPLTEPTPTGVFEGPLTPCMGTLSTINVHVAPVFWNQSVALKPADAEYVPCRGLIQGRSWAGRHVGGNVAFLTVALARGAVNREVASSAPVTAATTNLLGGRLPLETPCCK